MGPIRPCSDLLLHLSTSPSATSFVKACMQQLGRGFLWKKKQVGIRSGKRKQVGTGSKEGSFLTSNQSPFFTMTTFTLASGSSRLGPTYLVRLGRSRAAQVAAQRSPTLFASLDHNC